MIDNLYLIRQSFKGTSSESDITIFAGGSLEIRRTVQSLFLGFVIVDLVSFFSAGDLIKVCEKLNSPRCCFFNSFTQHFDGGMRDLIINYEGVIYKNISPLSKNELTKKRMN